MSILYVLSPTVDNGGVFPGVLSVRGKARGTGFKTVVLSCLILGPQRLTMWNLIPQSKY